MFVDLPRTGMAHDRNGSLEAYQRRVCLAIVSVPGLILTDQGADGDDPVSCALPTSRENSSCVLSRRIENISTTDLTELRMIQKFCRRAMRDVRKEASMEGRIQSIEIIFGPNVWHNL